jgi:hypothetical protein
VCAREEAMMNEAERGSLLPLLAVILVLAASLMLAIGRLGEAAVARARARSAADAAALAGAADDRAAATAMAEANGARLLVYEPRGRDVRVTVQWGRVRATARARAASDGYEQGARGRGMARSP